MDAPLDKINDIIIGQKLVGKILGYSRIIIFTSSSKYVYDFISNAEVFRDYLNDNGIVATIRRELGSDIDAACGQLRRKNLKNQEEQ